MANTTRSRRIIRHANRLLNGVGGFGVDAPYVSRTVIRENTRQRKEYRRLMEFRARMEDGDFERS